MEGGREKRFGCASYLKQSGGLLFIFLSVIACDTRQGNEASMGAC
jgi:hypothetical protein